MVVQSLKLDPSDPRPLYVQLADRLVAAIESDEFTPGERLPAMRDLARKLDCALVTVSQAYELLATRGRVIARPGKGTYVASPRIAPSLLRADGSPTSGGLPAVHGSKA